MKFENLAILLTCHSLEDFPVHHEGDDADSLLANWTALWHPRLIADANSIPTWIRTFEVPENCQGYLFACPTTSDSELQTGFAQRVKEEGGRIIRRKKCRAEIISSIFDECTESQSREFSLPGDQVNDFFALGYCYLQIQLLTRQLRYSSNLDEVYFSNLVIEGAKAAVAGDTDIATSKLQASFDLLMEERDNYYPVNALIIDLTLLADTTLGSNLETQLLDRTIHANYLMSGHIAKQVAASPQLVDLFRQSIECGNTTIVGGSEHETRFPLLSTESVIDEFARGKSSYQEILPTDVDFYGRRRFGLMTSLPQILEHFGFKGAFHFTLDEGRFPEGMQIKSFWEGDGEAQIEVFGKVPLDASAPGNFLNLGVKIGESFDMDHAAAICFVHWPGKTSVWYQDLKRICSYGSVLGKFVSTKQFLEEMEEPYQHDRFSHDQYQSPYFKQAVIGKQANPISRSMDYWRRSLTYDSIRSLDFLSTFFSKKPSEKSTVTRSEIVNEFESKEPGSAQQLDDELFRSEQQAAQRFVDSLTGEAQENETQGSTVVINTDCLVQRSSIFVAGNQIPEIEKPVYSSSRVLTRAENQGHAVVDVPAMGYATLSLQPSSPKRDTDRPTQLLVDENSLRNEFLEIILDPKTGGIQAVHDYKTRGNRLSQVLASRAKSKENDGRFEYSSMVLDSMETVHNTSSFGLVKTTGHLLNDDQKIAEFTQEFSLSRGSRALSVEIELRHLESPTGDPWNCYVGSRFAFNDESSLVSTTLNQSRQTVSGSRIEAPHYIDLENVKSRTSILTAGVPFHVRRGDRYLDSIYVVKGESCRRFQFGIGVDLTNPLFQAYRLIKPPLTVLTPKKIAPGYGWFFHFDSKNVVATSWEPVFEQEVPIGFRARLLETMGRESKFKLSAFKEISQASRIRFDGELVSEIPVENGKAAIHLCPNQLIEIEARW